MPSPGGLRVVKPSPTRDDEFFWRGVDEGKLLIARCAGCGLLQHPPTPMCPACGSLDWNHVEASGRGTVYSWVVSRHPTKSEPGSGSGTGSGSGSGESPRIVGLIDLEEGTRFVSNLVDVAVEDVRNEMAVELTFREYDGVKLPQFRPAAPAGGASAGSDAGSDAAAGGA